jgi:DNA-binding LytR/AlgR family response regulator
MFSCLIVDDEPLARKLVASYLLKMKNLNLIGQCQDAIEAGRFLREKRVDLVFLDIQMPEISGFQFIKSLKKPPAVILTTAHREFALDAFDLDAVDYLLKPISFERFFQAVNKFLDRQAAGKNESSSAGESSFVYLKSNRKIHKVLLADIRYVESLDDYVKVHLVSSQINTHEGINALEKSLSGGSFVRIHRSFIVNATHIRTISGEGVEIGGKVLPFGRAFKLSALASLSLKGDGFGLPQ